MKKFKKTLKILTLEERYKFCLLSFLSVIRTLLEVIGVSLLIPILTLITNSTNLNKIFSYLPVLKEFNEKNLLILFVLIFLIIYFIKTCFNIFYNKLSSKFIQNLYETTAEKILDKYLQKDYLFFKKFNSAKLIRNIYSESNLFAVGIVGSFIILSSNLMLVFGICLLLLFYNFYSAYVLFILVLLSYFIIKINNRKFEVWGEVRNIESEILLKKLNEILGSIKEVILYNKKDFFQRSAKRHLSRLADASMYKDISISISAPIIEFLGVLVFFSFFLFLVFFKNTDYRQTVITFGIFAFASLKLLPYTIQILKTIQNLKFNLPAINNVYNILKENNKIIIKKKKVNELQLLSFNNLYFKYPENKKNTLNNINFNLKIGDVIGVIGTTGSGKTTLINLISGLIQPNKGKILINNLFNSKLIDIKDKIGYVSQSVYLSDDTIDYNIGLREELSGFDKEKIRYLLEKLNLTNLNLKKKVGERGSQLSGGQIQRIGIARALFREPLILIMDEATNALDENSEKKIFKYLLNNSSERIIIFCTHKKRLLKYCNRIFEVKNNRLKTIHKNNYN